MAGTAVIPGEQDRSNNIKERVLELKEVWDFGIILDNLQSQFQDLSTENRRRGNDSSSVALERVLATLKKCKLELSSVRRFCRTARYIRSWDLLDSESQSSKDLDGWLKFVEVQMLRLCTELKNSNWGTFAASCEDFESILTEAAAGKRQKMQLVLEELRDSLR